MSNKKIELFTVAWLPSHMVDSDATYTCGITTGFDMSEEEAQQECNALNSDGLTQGKYFAVKVKAP